MSSNVGLSTPRGTGTSGYIQGNKALLRHRQQPPPRDQRDTSNFAAHKPRQPDAEILEHDRKRAVEVKVFELRDKLEEDGLPEDEVDARCDALRAQLTTQSTSESNNAHSTAAPNARNLKSHQVHELARAKIEESEKLRRALGISKDYEEGSHWRRQEERKVEGEKRRSEVEAGIGEAVGVKSGRGEDGARRGRREERRSRSPDGGRGRGFERSRTPESRSRSRSDTRSRSSSRSRSRSSDRGARRRGRGEVSPSRSLSRSLSRSRARPSRRSRYNTRPRSASGSRSDSRSRSRSYSRSRSASRSKSRSRSPHRRR